MSVIRFQRINLNETLPEIGLFDVIFCRNVLIYFDADGRRRAIDRLLARLDPQGYLFLGHSESLIGANDRMRAIAPSVYARGERSHDE